MAGVSACATGGHAIGEAMEAIVRGQADIVIGDRHGSSAAPWVAAEAAGIARNAGFSAALNEPYAGGAIIAGLPFVYAARRLCEIRR